MLSSVLAVRPVLRANLYPSRFANNPKSAISTQRAFGAQSPKIPVLNTTAKQYM